MGGAAFRPEEGCGSADGQHKVSRIPASMGCRKRGAPVFGGLPLLLMMTMMVMKMMMMMMIAVMAHDLMVLLRSRVLESKLQEAKAKKDTLKARAASAKTSKQLNEMLGSLGDSSNSYVAFEKMEEKVIAMEAESEAVGMLGSGNGSDNSLEAKFAMLEGTDTDAELVRADNPHLPPFLLPHPLHAS